jgi:hypothetical protein
MPWAVATPGAHRFDIVRLALEDRLDRAVGPVEHPPGHAPALRLMATHVAERNALDFSADHDMATNHGITLAIVRRVCLRPSTAKTSISRLGFAV